MSVTYGMRIAFQCRGGVFPCSSMHLVCVCLTAEKKKKKNKDSAWLHQLDFYRISRKSLERRTFHNFADALLHNLIGIRENMELLLTVYALHQP